MTQIEQECGVCNGTGIKPISVSSLPGGIPIGPGIGTVRDSMWRAPWPDEPHLQCTECKGKGFVYETQTVRCPTCGDGWVDAETKRSDSIANPDATKGD